jgi:hypothetical protein
VLLDAPCIDAREGFIAVEASWQTVKTNEAYQGREKRNHDEGDGQPTPVAVEARQRARNGGQRLRATAAARPHIVVRAARVSARNGS